MSTPHPSDEDLSAHLDGEAAEVAEHVGACAACRSRLDDLRRAAALVAAPPPPPDALAREGAIALAMGASAVARPRRLALLAAAAAIVVAVGVATPLLLRSRGQHRTTTALSSPKAASGRNAGGTEAAADNAASIPIDGGDLGDQSDPAALGRLVSDALVPAAGSGASAGSRAAPPAPAPDAASGAGCSAPINGGQVVYRGALRWKGTPAQLFAIQPGRRLVVMDSAHCQVLVDRHF